MTDQRPEYESTTTTVYRAVDEHTLDQHNQPVRVVLKLTRSMYKYRREVRARGYLGGALDENYVVPHIRLHHHPEYEPLLPTAAAAADIVHDNDVTSGDVDGSDIIDDRVDPVPSTPVGQVVPCTGSGEGECAVLAAARKTANHWLSQRSGARARATGRGSDPMSSSLTHTNNNAHTNADFDDDGWSQFDEGSDETETAPSQTAQSNLTAPDQETEKRGSSRGDSGRATSRGGSGSNSNNGLILSKRVAHRMLTIVMPQADRTLLTALKHEHSLVKRPRQLNNTSSTDLKLSVSVSIGIDDNGRSAGVRAGAGVGARRAGRAGVEAVSLSKVRSIFTQLLDAMAHMHDKGYLHGDLCPMNIGQSVCLFVCCLSAVCLLSVHLSLLSLGLNP